MEPTNPLSQFYKPRKDSVYISYCRALYAAVKEDIDTFLAQFTKKETLNYVDFALIWQSMQMTCIFCDQRTLRALRVFCDVCFTLLKKTILQNPDIYHKIGAFYLLYGIYYKQPLKEFVKIRLTLEEYKILKALMQTMCDKGQYDALYIFAKMKSDEAFVYVAHPKPMAIMFRQKFDMPEEIDDFVLQKYDRPLNSFKTIVESESIQSLADTCKTYDVKMQELAERYPGLSMFDSSIVNEIKTEHENLFGIVRYQKINDSNHNSNTEKDSIMDTRQRIRKKAFRKKHEWLEKKLECSSKLLKSANDTDADNL